VKKRTVFLFAVLFLTGTGYGVNQPQNIGSVAMDAAALPVKTVAQINALTSDATGQVVFCSNCLQSALCVSSGTVAPGAWTVSSATSTAVLGGLLGHCN
jgi:hypothetical protein